MDRRAVAFLASEAGASWVESVGDVSDDDLLPTIERLRRSLSPEFASAVVETARLRVRARAKFAGSGSMLFTADGLEQATSEACARLRAQRFEGVPNVADLGCGIGGDAIALASVADVLALDTDPVLVAMAAHNLDGGGHAVIGDARRPPIVPSGWGIFLDPARRSQDRRRFDPGDWKPSLDEAVALARVGVMGAIKCAPGLDHDAIPPDAFVEWVSLGGDLKECVLWFGTGLDPEDRSAVDATTGRRFTARPHRRGPIQVVGRWLFEPDPAVIRAGLVANLAESLGLARIDPHIAYLTGPDRVDDPFVTGYPVESVHPFRMKALRAHLRHLGVGSVTVKKRGSPLRPEEVRAGLDLRGDEHRILVLTRTSAGPIVVVARDDQSGRAQT